MPTSVSLVSMTLLAIATSAPTTTSSAPSSSSSSAAAAAAVAAAVPPGEALTMARVIALASEHAPDAVTASAQVAVSAAAVDRATAAAMPSVSLSSSVSPGVQVTMPLLSQDENALCSAGNLACSVGAAPVGSARAGASVDLRWRLFDFGAIAASVDEREAALQATSARAKATTSRAVATALKAYLLVLADDELVAVRRRLVDDRRKQAEVVRGRVELGEGSPADILQADVAAEAAALDLEVALSQARVDRVTLAAAIGLGDVGGGGGGADIVVDGSLDIDPANVDPDLDAHPTLRAAQLDVDGGRAGVARAERSLLPTIDGSASVGTSLVAITKPDANLTPSAGLGLSLSWPLLDLGRGADVRTAEASAVVAEKTRQATLVQLSAEQRRAQTQLQAQSALVRRAERLTDSARQAYDVTAARLAAGAARFAEVLDAQAALAQAEATLVNARVQRAAAVVDVVAASGVVDGASFAPAPPAASTR